MTKDKTAVATNEWKMRATCEKDKAGGCGEKFEISQKDLFLFHDFTTGFDHRYAATRCPRCSKTIGLSTPTAIFDKLLIKDSEQEEAKFFTHVRARNGF